MKIRTGKIARLPFVVRNELNRRIENGEPGTKLVTWLNGTPEVKGVLREHFGGREITEQNLSDWIAGGYQDWLALKRFQDEAHQLAEDAGILARTANSLPENLATVLSIRYAALMMEWDGEMTDEFERKLRGMDRLRQSVTALQQGYIKHWEVDIESRRYYDGVKKEFLERRSEEATNRSFKEMMIWQQEQWNREFPDNQRHYSFLEPSETRRRNGWGKKRGKHRPGTRRRTARTKAGGVEEAKGVEKEKPRALNVEPSNLERGRGKGLKKNIQRPTSNAEQPTGVEELKSLRVEEAGKGKEEGKMQNAEKSETGAEPTAKAKAENEGEKQHLVEEIKPKETAEEGNQPQTLEAPVVEEKRKVRVDAIVWPHRVSKWGCRGLDG